MSQPEEIQILNKRLRLAQPANGFRTALDSVMLAAACPAQEGQTILDLGCGVGGAGFCVLLRVPGTTLTGIEIQPDHVELATQNIALNGFKNRAAFVCGDVRAYEDARADHVICNPPYLEAGRHLPSPHAAKATAHGHQDEELSVKDWIDAAHRNLKSGGSLTIIHRADALDKILQGLGKRFGAVETIPLWPRMGQPAKRVIIRAVKDRKTPSLLHAGLTLHQENGDYTPQADAVLRDMKPL